MHDTHTPDWVQASTMLREAMELYRGQQQHASLSKVIKDLID